MGKWLDLARDHTGEAEPQENVPLAAPSEAPLWGLNDFVTLTRMDGQEELGFVLDVLALPDEPDFKPGVWYLVGTPGVLHLCHGTLLSPARMDFDGREARGG